MKTLYKLNGEDKKLKQQTAYSGLAIVVDNADTKVFSIIVWF